MMRRRLPIGLAGLLAALLVLGCSASPRGRGADRSAEGPVRLVPDAATAVSRITVAFADPGRRPEDCRYEWRCNGSLVPGVVSDALEPGSFRRGDRIEVTVVAPDGGAGAERRWHAGLTIINSPPVVLGVSVRPATTSERAELTAVPEAKDPDGDPLTYTYRWFRGGKPVAGAVAPTLPMDGLGSGEQVVVEVVASDGQDASAPLRSDAVDVRNRPPVFTSQPVVPGPADSVYRYQAAATDPDGDVLRYELTEGPPGMTMGADGLVRWALPAGDRRAGEYTIAVRAVDAKGAAAAQRFSIRVAPPSPRR